jgi:hypothetical protein
MYKVIFIARMFGAKMQPKFGIANAANGPSLTPV